MREQIVTFPSLLESQVPAKDTRMHVIKLTVKLIDKNLNGSLNKFYEGDIL
jgi:hypothetical protein